MPIRPENKHRYPANWDEIRKGILERAKHRCEGCGLYNGEIGYRDEHGVFHSKDWNYCQQDGQKPIRIVLTIAHLDHTPENNNPANLRAWCQRCHNRYDAPYRAANRKARRERDNNQ